MHKFDYIIKLSVLLTIFHFQIRLLELLEERRYYHRYFSCWLSYAIAEQLQLAQQQVLFYIDKNGTQYKL